MQMTAEVSRVIGAENNKSRANTTYIAETTMTATQDRSQPPNNHAPSTKR